VSIAVAYVAIYSGLGDHRLLSRGNTQLAVIVGFLFGAFLAAIFNIISYRRLSFALPACLIILILAELAFGFMFMGWITHIANV
jgi:hypothetical protein